MLARSVDRVVSHTDPDVNERIERQTEMSLCYYRAHPDEIDQRLEELDEEWDLERALEACSSAVSLIGFTWGLFRRRWWLAGLAAQGYFMQHALQGWAPPVGVLRRLGFRTAHEIEHERYALMALRGEQPGRAVRRKEPTPVTEPVGESAFQSA
jgi:hypothetical protein